MQETNAPVEVVKNDTLTEIQLKAIQDAQDELTKLRNEMNEKKYLVGINKDQIKKLKQFMINDAPWKYTEGLGIIELRKILTESEKSGKLFLDATALEAAFYYLTKVEGTGEKTNMTSITTVDEYIALVKPFQQLFNGEIAKDAEKIKKAEFVLEARAQGVNVEESAEKSE